MLAKRKATCKKRWETLTTLRKQLDQEAPDPKRSYSKPKTLESLNKKIDKTRAYLNQVRADAERRAALNSSQEVTAPVDDNQSDASSHEDKLAVMQKEIERLNAQLNANKRQNSLIGKIQLEKFDTSTDGRAMSKDEAIKKWPRWKKNLQTIRDDDSDASIKHAHLRNFGGPFIREVDEMTVYGEASDTGNPFEDLLKKLDNYLKKDEAMKIADRTTFSRTTQRADESIDDFFHRLQVNATACDFGGETTEKIQEQLIAHGRNRVELFRLASEKKSLPDIVAYLRLQEAGEREQRNMNMPPPRAPITVLAVDDESQMRRSDSQRSNRDYEMRGSRRDSRGRQDSNFGNRDRSFSQPNTDRRCSGCNGQWHSRRQDCPAWGKSCNKCGRRNHFEGVCRGGGHNASINNRNEPPKKNKIHTVDSEDWDEFDPKVNK